jgi:hypothetical protein
MWLRTPFGFVSIVETPEDRPAGMRTGRARVRGDIEALRTKYLLEMTEIVATPERDYAFRGRVTKQALGAAMARIVQDIDYSHTRTAVAQRMGYAREQVYYEVAEILSGLQHRAPERKR